MADNKVSVELTIEQAQALDSLRSIGSQLDKFSKSAEKAANNASGSFNSFGKTVAAVFSGNILAEFATRAVDSLLEIPEALGKVIEKGIEAEAANRRLGQALVISGNASEDAKADFEALAADIASLTGVQQEAVKSAETFALTLGATSDQAQKIVKTAADLSVALGVDFNTAVQQLSQTLEGSAGRLGRVSFEVRQLDEDALRSGAAIDILAKKFGGLADLNALNVGVQLKNIGNGVEDLVQSFGEAIVNSDALKAVFIATNSVLRDFGRFIDENKGAITKFTDGLVQGFLTSTQAIAAFTDASLRLGAIIKNVVEIGLGGLATSLNLVDSAIEKILNLFRSEPSTRATDQLSESIKSVNQDTTDLLNAFDPSKFNATSEAIVSFRGTVEDSLQGISAAEKSATEKQKALAEQSAIDRAAERQKRLEEEAAFQEQLFLIREQANINAQAQALALEDTALLSLSNNAAQIQAFEEQKINTQFAAQERKLQLMKEGTEKERAIALNAANQQAAVQQSRTQFEANQQRIRNENLKSSLSSIATLTASSNKELFAIGKAAAIATATIDGIAAVQKALASAPPPFNFVLAALVGTAQAINLSKIASTQPPAFAGGGIVGGSSFTGDNVTARVNSGEMILNKDQQANLFDIAKNGSSGGSVISAINALGDRIAAMQVQINVNGRELARIVRDEREAGFAV